MIGLLNNITREPSDQNPSKIFTATMKNTAKTKQVYLKEHENWMQKKAEDLNMKSFFKGTLYFLDGARVPIKQVSQKVSSQVPSDVYSKRNIFQ